MMVGSAFDSWAGACLSGCNGQRKRLPARIWQAADRFFRPACPAALPQRHTSRAGGTPCGSYWRRDAFATRVVAVLDCKVARARLFHASRASGGLDHQLTGWFSLAITLDLSAHPA